MGWLTGILKLFGFFGALFNWFKEATDKKEKAKKDALKQVKEGVKNDDTSAITAGFDKFNNAR